MIIIVYIYSLLRQIILERCPIFGMDIETFNSIFVINFNHNLFKR